MNFGLHLSTIHFFMVVMLVSGTCNTLLMKFMVMQRAPLSSDDDIAVGFDHPYFQSFLMMFGESLCLMVHWQSTSGETLGTPAAEAPMHVFGVACLFDWSATTLVNMAYVLIPASVVQMTRGAIVIFTCVFSMVFLRRRQHAHHFLGVGLVATGISLVSFSTVGNVSTETNSSTQDAVGISLCIAAQVFQALMLVYEEQIMSKYVIPPLRVVGMEGAFGILFGAALLGFLNIARMENTPAACYQLMHCPPLLLAASASILSIALFNFSGVTVTSEASAVTRSTIDVSRTILIWAMELVFGWNSFSKLQFLGFVVLALGTMIYNRLLIIQKLEPQSESSILKAKSAAALCYAAHELTVQKGLV